MGAWPVTNLEPLMGAWPSKCPREWGRSVEIRARGSLNVYRSLQCRCQACRSAAAKKVVGHLPAEPPAAPEATAASHVPQVNLYMAAEQDHSDWQFAPAEFQSLVADYGPVSLDCCSDALGRNALTRRFLSPAQDCLQTNLAGESCWINPPFRQAAAFGLFF